MGEDRNYVQPRTRLFGESKKRFEHLQKRLGKTNSELTKFLMERIIFSKDYEELLR